MIPLSSYTGFLLISSEQFFHNHTSVIPSVILYDMSNMYLIGHTTIISIIQYIYLSKYLPSYEYSMVYFQGREN